MAEVAGQASAGMVNRVDEVDTVLVADRVVAAASWCPFWRAISYFKNVLLERREHHQQHV